MRAAALVVLALAATAPAAAANDAVVATVAKPTIIDAYGGRAVWSTWDPAAGAYRLTEFSRGAVRPVPVAPSGAPFDVDLGRGPHGGTVAVYSRCARPTAYVYVLDGRHGCDLYAYRFATGREAKLTRASSPDADEFSPAVWGNRLAFARAYRARHGGSPRRVLYYRALSGRGRSHRLAPNAAAAFEGGAPQELDMRGERVTFRVAEEYGAVLWLSRIGGGARKLVQTPGSGAEVRHTGVQGPTLAGRVVHWALTVGQDDPTFTEFRTVAVRTGRNRRATTRVDADDPLFYQATSGFAYDRGAVWYVRDAAKDTYEVRVATGLQYEPAKPPRF